MIRRFVLYSVLALYIAAQPAFAQDQVRVRTGEHDEYSRLVFDWDAEVEYDLDESKAGLLQIKFKDAAKVSERPTKALRNISNFTVVSESPLAVSINVPEDSRSRTFFAGTRLVVDVYNSPSAKAPSTAAAPKVKPKPEPAPEPVKQAAAPEPAPEPEAKPEPVKEAPPKPAPAPEQVAEEVATPNPPPSDDLDAVEVEPAKTVARDGAPPEEELNAPAEEKPVQKITKKLIRPNIIALSSTQSFGLAAFEMNNEIWMVNDQATLTLRPNISGPDVQQILPVQTMDVEGGKAFRVNAPPGSYVSGEGGGLIWRVVVTPEEHGDDKSIKPVREGVEKGQVRSGRVIWPFEHPRKVLDVLDPVSGVTMKVVTVESTKEFAGKAQDFVDFKTLPSPIGLVIVPKVDDLSVRITDDGVEVSRLGGLAITAEDDARAARSRAQVNQKSASGNDAPKIFDFKNWEMGGLDALGENRNVILTSLNDLPEGKKLEDIITLAKMHLANGLAPEALGFLGLARDLLPEIAENPQFRALNAAAKAMVTKSEAAFIDLSQSDLKPYGDVDYWRAFALADLGDWQQAQEVIPKDLSPLRDYPPYLYNRLAIVLAEVALRAGDVASAEVLFDRFEEQKDTLLEPQAAAYDYLKGEAARQRGHTDDTKELWGKLVVGKDDLYRAKAGLALTRLQTEAEEISFEQAIDNLERLRYAWRGDDVEAQINYWLGRTYFDAGQYAKGLNILRDAATYASETPLGPRITAEMSDLFSGLFLTDRLEQVSPLDATALYEQFTELVPQGERGDQVVEMLAERLVQADLLGRAIKLLQHQVDHRLNGSEGHRVAVRLAAIQLLDNKPKDAIETLKKATSFLQGLPEEAQTPARYLELSLLRARALSRQGRPDQALALLNDLERSPDVNRLKADIAWNAGYWDDAGEALGDVVLDRNISFTRPLEDFDVALILQRAVALSLAGDRVALANMREKYADLMAQSDKAKTFDVITRARQSSALADRETLMNIVSETDLFADFLNSYRTASPPSN